MLFQLKSISVRFTLCPGEASRIQGTFLPPQSESMEMVLGMCVGWEMTGISMDEVHLATFLMPGIDTKLVAYVNS